MGRRRKLLLLPLVGGDLFFNLYFGLKQKRWKSLYWLDLRRLAEHLVSPRQRLQGTKYFTARISSPPDKVKRQTTYLEALGVIPELKVFFGKYQLNPRQCRHCGHTDRVPNEKMTDVNIAVELLADAFTDGLDTGIIVSADSDLAPAILKVKELFPAKRVVVAFPPARRSSELKKICHGYRFISRVALASSLLPDQVRKPDGFVLERPPEWR